MLLAARFLVPLQIFPPGAGEVVAITAREDKPLVSLLHVSLERPWSLERFIAANFAANELWMVMSTDHVGCEVVRVVVALAT